MGYCLIKPLAEAFKKAIKDGRVDPQKLADSSSEERHRFFSTIIGEQNAAQVNALFESQMLLKNRQQAMVSWAKQVTGIRPEVRNDLISRIERLDERILNPQTEKAFLEDLAARRLGTEVTIEEARQVTELARAVSKAKANFSQDPIAYGAASVALDNYVSDIRRQNSSVRLSDLRTNPVGTGLGSVISLAGFTKSMKATLDVSALGRQGYKTIFTHPGIWRRNAQQAFVNVYRTLRTSTSDNRIMDAIKAEIRSRVNFFNGAYRRMKLDIGTGEEAYPEELPERIPGVGRVFKASKVAYEGFLMRLRADIADAYLDLAEKNGIDTKNQEEAQAIGRLVNSLTGRGSLGSYESAGKALNVLFFSPKSVKANLDFLTMHLGEKIADSISGKRTSSFVQKQAAINLVKVLGGTAAILAFVKALFPKAVEEDPRSSDFGKIRLGNTRFDVSGGMPGFFTLAARLLTSSTKSSTSGSVTELGSDYNQKSPIDVLLSFTGNKLSPVAAVLRNLINRTDREGNPLTAAGIASDLFVPLPVTNAIELHNDPNAAPIWLGLIADALGFATNTYGDSSKIGQRFSGDADIAAALHEVSNLAGKKITFEDWDTSKNGGLAQFREKSDPGTWDAAKRVYSGHVSEEVKKALKSPKFEAFSPEDKAAYLNQIDENARDATFKEFGFKPKVKKAKKKNKLTL